MITALIGASVLCIAASAGVLVWGWSTANETLIWTSIGASGAAAVLLALAYVQSRTRPAGSPATEPAAEPERPTSSPKPETTGSSASAQAPTRARRPRSSPQPETAAPPSREESIAETAAAAAASVAAAKPPALAQQTPAPPKATAKPSTKKTPAPSGRGGTSQAPKATAARKERKDVQGDVVAVPERKKFHRPECRYSQAQGAERISKAAARRRGYSPCGVCKP